MTLLLVIGLIIRINPLIPFKFEPPVEDRRPGLVLWYDPGVMGGVVDTLCSNRAKYPHAKHLKCDDAYRTTRRIASPHYTVGTYVVLNGYIYLVVDTSAPEDKARHLKRGLIAETEYERTEEICGAPETNCQGWIWP